MIQRLAYYIFALGLLLMALSCTTGPEEAKRSDYFEGEIELIVSRGILGNIFRTKITYLLSENMLKREERSVNEKVFSNYAGILIDLQTDSVEMYYVKSEEEGSRYRLSTQEYLQLLEKHAFERRFPSPVDQTFLHLKHYQFVKQVPDSSMIQEFSADYTLYQDSTSSFEQGVFDSKDIRVQRSLLEMAFVNLQKEVNFPLGYTYHTSVWGIIANKDSSTLSTAEKWAMRALDKMKKGVDQTIQITATCSKLVQRQIKQTEFVLPDHAFVDVDTWEAFMASLAPIKSEEEEDDDDDDDDDDDGIDKSEIAKQILDIID